MADYPEKTKEGKCIFCEIAKGNLKPIGEGTIYEDEKYIAWLSPFPNTKGFTVIIPKEHYTSDILKMPQKELHELIDISKKVAEILENYFRDVGRVGLIMEGTGIDHAHIKLFPMHGTSHIKEGKWIQYSSKIDTYFNEYQGYISSHDGPKAKEEEIKKLAEDIRKAIKK